MSADTGTVLDRFTPEQAWAGTVAALFAAVAGGSLAFPREVYGGFVWHYFWGPVYADANGAECAVWDGGARTLVPRGPDAAATCARAAEPVAYPGYTLYSEVGYMLVLVLALVGITFLLRRLQVAERRSFFYALLPFVFFGGALRVVEDAADSARVIGAGGLLEYPLNALIISPVIYATMFAVTLAVLVAAVWLARRGVVASYERPLFAAGAALLVLSIAYLAVLSATTDYVDFYPQFLLATLLGATLAAAATWWLVGRYAPSVNSGTGFVGAVVIWGHAVDGTANVLALDWATAMGLPYNLTPKHPVNAAVRDLTQAVLPAAITDVTGAVWPFLPLKLVVAVLAVWLFNDEMFEESPRTTLLLLVAVLAVGLGPGTRDMLRATFGV